MWDSVTTLKWRKILERDVYQTTCIQCTVRVRFLLCTILPWYQTALSSFWCLSKLLFKKKTVCVQSYSSNYSLLGRIACALYRLIHAVGRCA